MSDWSGCDCGTYSGLQYMIHLGNDWPFSKAIKIARCTHHERITWGAGGMYEERALLVPADLWDMLHTGLGLGDCAVHCVKCGAYDDVNHLNCSADMVRARLCKHCYFIAEKVRGWDDDNDFVANGRIFHICPEPKRVRGDGWGLGFGGKRWRVEFFDGRVAHTRNLWAGGDVPEAWRGDLPDSAKLMPADNKPSAYIGSGSPRART